MYCQKCNLQWGGQCMLEALNYSTAHKIHLCWLYYTWALYQFQPETDKAIAEIPSNRSKSKAEPGLHWIYMLAFCHKYLSAPLVFEEVCWTSQNFKTLYHYVYIPLGVISFHLRKDQLSFESYLLTILPNQVSLKLYDLSILLKCDVRYLRTTCDQVQK